jgi:hypothetical protein
MKYLIFETELGAKTRSAQEVLRIGFNDWSGNLETI